MYGLFTIKYGKSFLVQQFRTEEEAKKKYEELASTKSSEKENEEYFIRKI
jgi:hypothetical protein